MTVVKLPMTGWLPAPRECASLTYVNHRTYLMGGLNYDANKEVGELKIIGADMNEMDYLDPEWKNIDYNFNETI